MLHVVMSANFSAVGVVSVRPIADTHQYVGIGTNKVVTHTKIRKSGMSAYVIYILSDFAASQEQGTYLL